MGQILGDSAPLWGRGNWIPHLTQCGHGRGLPACQVSSLSVQPFGHNTPTLQSGQDRQDRQDRQRSDSIGRTVLQTVAQKLLSFSHIRDLRSRWSQGLLSVAAQSCSVWDTHAHFQWLDHAIVVCLSQQLTTWENSLKSLDYRTGGATKSSAVGFNSGNVGCRSFQNNISFTSAPFYWEISNSSAV